MTLKIPVVHINANTSALGKLGKQEHKWKCKRDELTEVEKNNNAKT